MNDIPVGQPLTIEQEQMKLVTHMFTPDHRHVLCGKTGELIATDKPALVRCIICGDILAEKAKEAPHD